MRDIFGETPETITIYLYESFAKTYRGHGTDVALVAGLLGMAPDDPRLPESLKLAYDQGIKVSFVPKSDKVDHPNTAHIVLQAGDHRLAVTGFPLVAGIFRSRKSMGLDIVEHGSADLYHHS